MRMVKVDDITFSLFVGNGLPQARMKEVEKLLIESGEADAVIQSSMLEYSIQKERAVEMLGVDDTDFFIKDARKLSDTDSVEAKSRSLMLKTTSMNNKLSKEELLKVQDLVVKFNDSCVANLSLEENLVQFYLAQRPGTFQEDVFLIVQGLETGIRNFNEKLKKALEDKEFDYATELHNLSLELSLQEKYELYINFLAALQTLCMDNLSVEQASLLEGFQTIRERLIVSEEVSEDMLLEVEEKITLLLKESTLCLGSIETLKGLIKELPQGTEAVEKMVTDVEQDFREKMVTSMATYIAYQNEELESLKGQELAPEAIAVSVAAGVEEMHVMQDLNAGRITVDKAIKVLKIIGGVALFLLLAYVAMNLIVFVSTLSAVMLMLTFGSGVLATIGAWVTAFFVAGVLVEPTIHVGGKIMNYASRAFDVVVDTWRKQAWPILRKALADIREWFLSLFQKKTIIKEEQQGDSVQTASTL